MTSGFADDGSRAFEQSVNLKYTINKNETALKEYDIDETCKWILANGFKRIGLQFPDELLPLSVPICVALKSKVESKVCIMGDTSFGNCCVDQVAGEHFCVDAIVHYGPACLTSSQQKIPVKYVFGNYKYEQDSVIKSCDLVVNSLSDAGFKSSETCIRLIYNFRYKKYCQELSNRLRELNYLVLETLPKNIDVRNLSDYRIEGSRLFMDSSVEKDKTEQQLVLLFVNTGFDLAASSVLLGFYRRRYLNFFLLHPEMEEIQSVSREIELLFQQRLLSSVTKAQNANQIGLLLGTLSCECYREMFDYLTQVMQRAGKNVHPMIVGKIKDTKLTNTVHSIDAFVIITCPENCLEHMVNRKLERPFLKPNITPYEMVCACCPSVFSERLSRPYITDYQQLLSSYSMPLLFEADNSIDNNGALIEREKVDFAVAEQVRHSLSYFGLDPKLGQSEVCGIIEGKVGIASGYSNEIK